MTGVRPGGRGQVCRECTDEGHPSLPRRAHWCLMADSITIDVDGTEVAITHPDKVFFPTRGETKLDLVRYYQAVAEPLLATVRDRPVLLQRFPDGAGGKSFFQKRVPKSAPPWLTTTVVSTPNGTTSDALVAGGPGAHPLGGEPGLPRVPRVAEPRGRPRRSPTSCASTSTRPPAWASPSSRRRPCSRTTCSTSSASRRAIKTSGSRGLHVYVGLQPRWDSYEVRAAAVALARELERRHPDQITAQWWKEERGAAGVRRLQPERTAQDRVRRVVRATARRRPGVDAHPLGRAGRRRCPTSSRSPPCRLGWPSGATPGRASTSGRSRSSRCSSGRRRDMAAGLMDAPWPPVYPKQPNEPPRVAPEPRPVDLTGGSRFALNWDLTAGHQPILQGER